METTSENKRSASFVCNRKELYAALSVVKMQNTAKLTFKTKFSEQKIMLVTSRFEKHNQKMEELSQKLLHKDEEVEAQFKWGTKSGKEYLDLEPRLTLLSEQSYNVEMKKPSLRAKIFAFFLPFLNNRLAVYKW